MNAAEESPSASSSAHRPRPRQIPPRRPVARPHRQAWPLTRTERPVLFSRESATPNDLVRHLEQLYADAGEPTLRDLEAFVACCRTVLHGLAVPSLSGPLTSYSYSTLSNAIADLFDERSRVGARTRRAVAITVAWALTAVASLNRSPDVTRYLGTVTDPTLHHAVSYWQDCMVRQRLAWALDVRRRCAGQAEKAASLYDAQDRRRRARPGTPQGRPRRGETGPGTPRGEQPHGETRPGTPPEDQRRGEDAAFSGAPRGGGSTVLPFRRSSSAEASSVESVPLRLLGPVGIRTTRVGNGDRTAAEALSGGEARAVFACLALRVSTIVPVNQLIDEVWSDRPPASAEEIIAGHVARMNDALEDSGTGVTVGAIPDGYRLVGRREQVDWFLFEDLVAQGRVLFRAGELRSARSVLADALELWQGQELGDVPDVPIRRLFAPLMAASRRAALTDRIDTDLALGRDDLVAELQELYALDPHDERLFAQLVQALHRAGRPQDAVTLYAQVPRTARQAPRTARQAPRTAQQAPPPPTATSFVGRHDDLGALVAGLHRNRLVTVTGPPGVGKSRLTREVMEQVRTRVDCHAWIVGLAGVRDPATLPQAVLSALGATVSPHRDPLDLVRSHLLGRDAVLVLDDCDRILPACADLALDLLRSSSAVRILVTSREPLSVPEETVHRLAPLPVPDAGSPGAAAVRDVPSVRLFCDRALAVRPGFELTDETAPTVAAICRAVDGLPLALELASARLGLLSAPELLSRLTDQLTLLSRHDHRIQERHRSLRASMATSCELLSEAEADLFTRLSTPPGEFTLRTAEAIVSPRPDDPTVMDLLHALVDRSLVVADPSRDLTRYRMLEPVRQYAASLVTEADAADAHARLAQHLLSVARTASEERRGPDKAHWLQVLDAERASIAAVLDTALAERHHDVAMELAALLWWWWANNPREGLDQYRRILAATRPDHGTVGSRPALDALLSAAVIASFVSPHEAMEYAERAHDEATALGDRLGAVRALQQISDCAFEVGDLPLARRTGEEALALADDLGGYAVARCRLTVAYNHLANLDLDQAERWTRRAGTAFDAIGDEQGRADADLALAVISIVSGRGETATGLLEQVLDTYRRADSHEDIAQTAVLLVRVRAQAGSPDGCADLLREACDIHTTIRHPWNVANDLDHIAATAAAWNDHTTAATLLAAAATVRNLAGLTPTPQNLAVREPVAQACVAALGTRGYQAASRNGSTTTLSSALALARTLTDR